MLNKIYLPDIQRISQIITIKNCAIQQLELLNKEDADIIFSIKEIKDSIEANNKHLLLLESIENEKLPIDISIIFYDDNFVKSCTKFSLTKIYDSATLVVKISKSNEDLQGKINSLTDQKLEIENKIENRKSYVEDAQIQEDYFFDGIDPHENSFDLEASFEKLIKDFRYSFVSINSSGAKTYIGRILEDIRFNTNFSRAEIITLFKNFTKKRINGLQSWKSKNFNDAMQKSGKDNSTASTKSNKTTFGKVI